MLTDLNQLCDHGKLVFRRGRWSDRHRIGSTWDGSSRSLYVDDVLVAEDAKLGLADSSSGLNIGTGHNMGPGTFWRGLIDDVRIYNRVVEPQDISRTLQRKKGR